jgi:hypothetical protein
MEIAERLLGVPKGASLDWVFQGGDDRLTIRNYGDDNSLSGDPGVLREVFSFLAEYLEVEKEDPPKFLGFLWTDSGWRLGVESYLSKTYLNERAPHSTFRKYPLFGWVEKRKIYARHGVAQLEGEVFPLENHYMETNGHPWSEVLINAHKESLIAGSEAGTYSSPAWLLDKDWMMTSEEKVASGLFEGMYPEETRPMIKRLLGAEWRTLLQ